MPKVNFKWISLLAAFLLFAQAATILHDVEHPFHEESSVCEVFLIVGNDSENGLPCTVNNIHFFAFSAVPEKHSDNLSNQFRILSYSIRAPPLFMIS